MAALTEGTDYFIRRSATDGATELIIYTVATVDDGDTLTVTLANYGINNFYQEDSDAEKDYFLHGSHTSHPRGWLPVQVSD